MAIYISSVTRGRQVAELLHHSFTDGGILGRNDMPEDIVPKGVFIGSLEHVNYITLTVAIDYQRDATILWNNSRITFEDDATRYLFEPQKVVKTELGQIMKDMQKHGLSQKHGRDAKFWTTICATLNRKWENKPLNFLEFCNWNAITILDNLRSNSHLDGGKYEADFPNLRGAKIGPLWVRMLRDNLGITQLKNLDKVPIPVDVHIARSSLALGIVKGDYNGRLETLFEDIRAAWFECVRGLYTGKREMVALDVDEPLWHLSKYGCSKSRDKATGKCGLIKTCNAREFCISGRVDIENSKIDLAT